MNRIEDIIYENDDAIRLEPPTKSAGNYKILRFVYGILALGILALVAYILLQLQFLWLHIIIFFVFVSTASFLGFRLSRIIRELEIVESDQSGLTLLRDFFYMPFVFLGQWLTKTYSQVNIIGSILDIIIDLPLKTILRLIRQWALFINERKDEL